MKSQLYPLVKVAIVLIIGILIGDSYGGYLPIYVWLSGVVLTAVLVVLLRKKVLLSSVILLLSVFFLGISLVCMKKNGFHIANEGNPHEYLAVIVSQPVEHGKVIKCDLSVLTDNGNLKINGAILKDTLERKHTQLKVGDGIMFYSRLEPLKSDNVSSTFNYERWAQVHDYNGQTFILYNNWCKARINLKGLSYSSRFRLSLLKYRQRMAERLHGDNFSDETLSVILAMTLGDKSMLKKETRQKFSDTGSAHLLALSGLHMSVFYGLFLLCFKRIRRNVIVQTLAIISVWMYVFLVGMPVSVVRAAAMLTIFAIVSLRNSDSVSLNSLSFAAVVLLFLNPLALWDISFQLSFLAVASILLCFRIMPLSRPRRISSRLKNIFLSYIMVALSAQIGTFPIVMHVFGNFTAYFLLSNLVVIPIAMAIIYTFVAYWLFMPIPFLQVMAGKTLASLTGLMLSALEWIGSLPYANISGIHISKMQVVCLYLLIICCYGIVYYARKVRRSATI